MTDQLTQELEHHLATERASHESTLRKWAAAEDRAAEAEAQVAAFAKAFKDGLLVWSPKTLAAFGTIAAVLRGDPCPIQPVAGEESTRLVLEEVLAERAAQDAKWGEANHPDYRPFHECTPSAERAREACQAAFAAGEGSWAHVLQEAVAEAADAAIGAGDLRGELVQVAAVAVAWIEAIDRRGAPS